MVNLESPGSKNHRPGSFPPQRHHTTHHVVAFWAGIRVFLGDPHFQPKNLGKQKNLGNTRVKLIELIFCDHTFHFWLRCNETSFEYHFFSEHPAKFKGCRSDPSLEAYFSAQSRSALEKVSQANARCAPSATGKTRKKQENPWSMFLNFFEDPSFLFKGGIRSVFFGATESESIAKQLILSFQKIRNR